MTEYGNESLSNAHRFRSGNKDGGRKHKDERRQGADDVAEFGPAPKYLGWPKVKNIVSLLIRVDKVASISQRLPYWVSEVDGQAGACESSSSGTEGSGR